MDRVSFAKALAAGYNLDSGLIVGKPTAELVQGAPRPLTGGLSSPKLEALFPGIMPPLGACLADFRERLKTTEGLAQPLPA